MSSPQTGGADTPSLAREWLYALRYWLHGRRGVAALAVSTVVIVAALNWSWLVAVGIAPLLIAVLPCAAMCALGLCMSRMAGNSCSSEPRSVETPKPDVLVPASFETGEPRPLLSDRSTLLEQLDADAAISPAHPPKPEEKRLT